MSQQANKAKSSDQQDPKLTPNGLLSTMLISLIMGLIFSFQSYYTDGRDALSSITALAIGALGLAISFIWKRIHTEQHRTLLYRLYLACGWPALLILSGTILFPEPVTSSLEIVAVNLPLFAAAVTLLVWVLNNKSDNAVMVPATLGLALFVGLFTNTLLDFTNEFQIGDAGQTAGGVVIRANEPQAAVAESLQKEKDKMLANGQVIAPDTVLRPNEVSLPDLTASTTSEGRADLAESETDEGSSEGVVTESMQLEPPLKSTTLPRSTEQAVVENQTDMKSIRLPRRSRKGIQRKVKSLTTETLPDWGYSMKDGKGPSNWYRLHPSFTTCGTGKEQSPITIPKHWELSPAPAFFYGDTVPFSIHDSGRAIEVRFPVGDEKNQTQPFIRIDGSKYTLEQMDFHMPSEHNFEKQALAPMEVHFVHRNKKRQQLFIVAAMVARGKHNDQIELIQNFFPESPGNEVQPTKRFLNLGALMPESREIYKYFGSLTTPPCTENVKWGVLRMPFVMSPQQIEIFRSKYENNSRPTQRLNYR